MFGLHNLQICIIWGHSKSTFAQDSRVLTAHPSPPHPSPLVYRLDNNSEKREPKLSEILDVLRLLSLVSKTDTKFCISVNALMIFFD